MLALAMTWMMKVKRRQMMGVRIWQMLVPICLYCRVRLLINKALNCLEFLVSLGGMAESREDDSDIDINDQQRISFD